MEKRDAINPVTGERDTVMSVKYTNPEEWIVLEGIAPALVSEEVAVSAHQRLKESRQTPLSGKVIEPERYLLRGGFILCGICGKSMSARRRSGRNTFYTCQRDGHSMTIRSEVADEFAWESALDAGKDPTVVLEAIKSRLSDSSIQEDVKLKRQVLLEYEQQIAGLADDLATMRSEVGRASIKTKIDKIGKDIENIRQEVAALEQSESIRLTAISNLKRLYEWYTSVGANPTAKEKRRVLYDLGVQVVINTTTSEHRMYANMNPLQRVYYKNGNTVSFLSGFCPVLPDILLRRYPGCGWLVA